MLLPADDQHLLPSGAVAEVSLYSKGGYEPAAVHIQRITFPTVGGLE